MTTTLTKTFSFAIAHKTVAARAASSAAMTPEQRSAAMMARMASASRRDFIDGRVF